MGRYVSDAIAAAKAELDRRGLSAPALEIAQENVEARNHEMRDRANEPLERGKATATIPLSMLGLIVVLVVYVSTCLR